MNKTKGVICHIEKDENMPVDELGRRADVVLDPAATVNRMNLGRLYEHYVNDLLEQTSMRMKAMLNFNSSMSLEDMYSVDIKLINQALNYLLGLFDILSPKQKEFILGLKDTDKIEYLYSVLSEHITLYMPPNSDVDLPKAITDIENSVYKPHVGKVNYVGNSGIRTTTSNNIRIADLYMMLLDKIADDWSSVSISKLQHFGIIAPQNKSEKFSYPYRNAPVRTMGESEARVMVGYTNLENVAEIVDRSNNPLTMRRMVQNILEADKPTNIYRLIDRTKLEFGTNKPLQMINHVFNTAGFKVSYRKDRR